MLCTATCRNKTKNGEAIGKVRSGEKKGEKQGANGDSFATFAQNLRKVRPLSLRMRSRCPFWCTNTYTFTGRITHFGKNHTIDPELPRRLFSASSILKSCLNEQLSCLTFHHEFISNNRYAECVWRSYRVLTIAADLAHVASIFILLQKMKSSSVRQSA